MTSNAVLSGFTVRNGATRPNTLALYGAGGGVADPSKATVVNCIMTNNAAYTGGGALLVTLNNCLLIGNIADFEGGGAYNATLNNCTVVHNYTTFLGSASGAGTYNCQVRNSIVCNNFGGGLHSGLTANYSLSSDRFTFSCSDPLPFGTSNIDAIPVFLDAFHIAASSPFRRTGSPLYASGFDMDGEP